MDLDEVAATRLLQEHFGIAALRDDQRKVVQHLLAGSDALVVWPTGSGKSLCFQLPALLAPEGALTVVLSPLIALMQDQVDRLRAAGVPATFLNSSLSRAEREARQERIARGEYRLLYVTPERFRKDAFVKAIGGRRITLLAVDEAHCISEWGHDFRPEYGKVGAIRRLLGSPPTIALTATATNETATDVVARLELDRPLVVRRPVTRDNLILGVTEVANEDEKLARLERIVAETPGPGIVYCALIRDLETIRVRLARTGRRVLVYHGDLPARTRLAEQREFLASDSAVVVATNAFGMGVDKPDIRYIVHAQAPGSIESYAQEIGRAGRDGAPARCELLYLDTDVLIQKQFHEWANPSERFVRDVFTALERWGDSIHAREQDDLVAEVLVKSRGDGRVDTALSLLESAGFIAGSFERKDLRVVRRPTDDELRELAPPDKRERDLRRLLGVVEFVHGEECRRAALERFFDPASEAPACGVCDRCAPRVEPEARADALDADRAADPPSSPRAPPPIAGRPLPEVPDAPVAVGDWILVAGRHTVRVDEIRRRGASIVVRATSAGDFRTRDYDISRIEWSLLPRDG